MVGGALVDHMKGIGANPRSTMNPSPPHCSREAVSGRYRSVADVRITRLLHRGECFTKYKKYF